MTLNERLEIQQRDRVYAKHILLNFILMPMIVETDTPDIEGQIPLSSIAQDIQQVLVDAFYDVNGGVESI